MYIPVCMYTGLMRKKVAGLRLEADECRAQMAALGVNERAYHVQVYRCIYTSRLLSPCI